MGRYVGPRTEHLELIAPGLKYNTGFGLKMGLEVGAATAGSLSGMHCELVDTRAKKPDAVIWGHNYGIVVNELGPTLRQIFAETDDVQALQAIL